MNNMKEQVLLQNIFKYLNNLNHLNLNNELCLLYQGLIEPLDYDFERICRDLGKTEGNIQDWYIMLLPEEQARSIDYYRNRFQ